ncbi:hypothetical protein V8E53_013330 [Lactarius tabidus]
MFVLWEMYSLVSFLTLALFLPPSLLVPPLLSSPRASSPRASSPLLSSPLLSSPLLSSPLLSSPRASSPRASSPPNCYTSPLLSSPLPPHSSSPSALLHSAFPLRSSLSFCCAPLLSSSSHSLFDGWSLRSIHGSAPLSLQDGRDPSLRRCHCYPLSSLALPPLLAPLTPPPHPPPPTSPSAPHLTPPPSSRSSPLLSSQPPRWL